MQRHDGHHDHVAAGQQRAGRRVPQPLDLVVDRRVLLDVGVRLRDVRLGLVVVVVGDEVLDRVVRQQLAELGGQLRREGLVGRHDEGRPLQLLDQPGRRRGLAGTGRAEQDDVLLAGVDARGELLDRLGLVAGRRVVGDDLERGDGPLQIGDGTHATTVRSPTDTCAGESGGRAQDSVPADSGTIVRRPDAGPQQRGQRGRRLLASTARTARHVHEAAAHLRPGRQQVLERVERRVADVGARRVRHLHRHVRGTGRCQRRLDRERREERRRRAGDDRDVDRCATRRCRGCARR